MNAYDPGTRDSRPRAPIEAVASTTPVGILALTILEPGQPRHGSVSRRSIA